MFDERINSKRNWKSKEPCDAMPPINQITFTFCFLFRLLLLLLLLFCWYIFFNWWFIMRCKPFTCIRSLFYCHFTTEIHFDNLKIYWNASFHSTISTCKHSAKVDFLFLDLKKRWFLTTYKNRIFLKAIPFPLYRVQP